MKTSKKLNTNKMTNSNALMTNCHKGGIKIRTTDNDYTKNPFEKLYCVEEKIIPVNSSGNISFDQLDLTIENYTKQDIFNLFGIKTNVLTENIMKDCKKTVLKTHPDKSRLEQKIFLFFSSAYKKLFSIYEYQNKSSKNLDDEYINNDIEIDNVLDPNNVIKDTNKFNKLFNEAFCKHRLEDPNETGYGDWLKSDEDIVFITNISKTNINSEMEKRKKHVQTLTTYTGVSEQFAPIFAGSTLMQYNDNFTSGSIFSNEGMGYTDLRQAYVESVIPVTEEDFHKIPKFQSVDEYKRFREKQI
jgi:hypothetical protein